MKQKLSDAMAEKFIAEGVIQEEDKAIYAYGWRALGMWCFCTLTMFLIGIIMGEFLFTMIYFISFSVLRAYYEGYHADSRIVCFFSSMLLFIGCVLAGKYLIPDANHLLLGMILVFLCVCMNIRKVAEFRSAYQEGTAESYEKSKLLVGIIVMLLMLMFFAGMLMSDFRKGYSSVFAAFVLTFILFGMKRIVIAVRKK